MKKSILIVALLAYLCLNLNAQNELGVNVFPQISSIHNKANRQGDPIYKAELTYAYGGGVTFMHDFRKGAYGVLKNGLTGKSGKAKLGMKVGLLYSAHDQKFTSRYRLSLDSTATHSGRKRFDYLKLPVNLRYTKPIPSTKFNLALYGGPQLSYLMKADGGIVYWEHFEDFDYYDLPFSDLKYFKRFTFDAVLGADLEYKISRGALARWVHLIVGIRADWSVTTVEHKDRIINNYPSYGQVRGYDQERGNSHNTTLSLVLGFNYLFHVPDHRNTRF